MLVDPGCRVHTIDDLRRYVGDVPPMARAKIRSTLDAFSTRFVASSPYVCVASRGSDGRMDVSPRGDDPGFVVPLDDATLVLPERPGNRLADTLTNLLERPQVGMLFLIPGCPETLRVNGTAEIHDGPPELLSAMAARTRTPKLAIVVRVEEVFMHCGRAASRARIWDATAEWENPRPDLLIADVYGLSETDARTLLDGYNVSDL